MRATRLCRPPHPNGILSSTIQNGWALFSINITLPAIHTHLISQFECKQSTFHRVKVHNRTIRSRSGDGSRHLRMWWAIVLHISWSTVTVGVAGDDIMFHMIIFSPGVFVITRVSEVITFTSCVFVCLWLCLCLYHDVCPDDLTMKDWCHTNNILQVHCWGCLVVQVMFHALMAPSMTSPGHKVGQILKLIYLRQYLS